MGKHSPQRGSTLRQLFQQRIEILKLRVLDNHLPTAVMILDVDLQSQRPLQPLLNFPHIWINYRLRLRFFLLFLFRMQNPLHIRLCLANRERKRHDPLSRLLHFFRMLKRQERPRMPEAQLSRFYARLHRTRQP